MIYHKVLEYVKDKKLKLSYGECFSLNHASKAHTQLQGNELLLTAMCQACATQPVRFDSGFFAGRHVTGKLLLQIM